MDIHWDLWRLIDHFCSVDEIQNVLRRFKELYPKSKELLISGTKEDLIVRLRHATQKHLIPIEEVLELLRESEENGSQHIFYFRPKSSAVARACAGAAFAKNVWGARLAAENFPSFELVPQSYRWADFRIGLGNKPDDWIAKLYGHEIRLEFLKNKPYQPTADEPAVSGAIARIFVPREIRAVSIVRWNAPDLLEIRIPRSDSVGTVRERLAIVWDHIKNALQQSQFLPWDLSKARRRILEERRKNGDFYRVGMLQFRDSESGRAEIHPHSEDEDADGASDREAAINAYLKGTGDCNEVRIAWQANGRVHGDWKSPLVTVCGGRNNHELLVRSGTRSTVLDHVTNNLRRFDR